MMRTLRPRMQGRRQAPPPPPKPTKLPVTDPVEVYCRLRPPEIKNDPICVAPLTCTTVQLSNPDPLQAFKSGNIKEMQYTFKFVFDEATSQKALFDHIALPLVSDLLHGKNGILFTYGVTGSGKTFTMTGTPQNGGLLPRSLDVIFNTIKDFQSRKYVSNARIFKPDKMNGFDVQTEADAAADRQKDLNTIIMKTPNPKTPRKREQDSEERIPDITKVDNIDEDNSYAVFVSYIEIYNNYVYDLLEDYLIDPIRPKPPQSKILREDANHNMYVHGCTEVEVKSTEEAFEVFYKGQRRRRVAHTTLNTESSRSHSVFTIRLVQAPLDPIGQEVFQDKNTVCVSQLSLVDLAGSERTVRTKNSGDRLREAGNINNSLMVLRTCIEILRENQANGTNKMVPYRDSKLTHLFKNYFDGEGKVRMIVCINPCGDDYDENIHVMRFAELTQEVQVTRPTAVIFDLGLTPGRRRANQLYKNLLEKETAVQPELEEAPAPVACLFSLGPSFPPFDLCDPADEALLVNLMAFLDERIRSRATAQTDLHAKQMSFRAQLDNMEKENLFLKQRINDLEALVERSKTIERRLVKMEYEKDSLERKLSAFERAKKTLEHELDEKEMLLNQGKFEKEKLKAHMQGRIITERERVTRNMEKKYREHQAELENKVWMKSAKLRALKEIVSDKWEPDPNSSRLRAVHSDSKLNESGDTCESRRVGRSVSPPQLKSIPVANPRHRRSRSASGEMWIAHNPVGNVELDGEVANYVLTHQEQDVAGDIETRLYKANVVPSAGGGAQVIFNDVETLRQISPQDGKKRSLERQAKDGIGHTDVELKCATGIEGHSYKKKRC